MTDKWEQLRLLLKAQLSQNVHYSLDRDYEHGTYKAVLRWMDSLDKKEKESNTFLYTEIPSFDRKAWERIMEEKGLQGLA